MALADEIRILAAQNLNALDASHNYYTNTLATWQLVREVVREDRKFTIHNRVTGAAIDHGAFLDLLPRYTKGYLASATFQQFVSIFEDFVFDLLGLWLAAYPQSLAEKEIKFGVVLKAPDKDAVTRAVVDRELNELKYERVADWFEYLDRRVKLDCPSPADIESLAEMKAARDILVHSKGTVNAIYVSKAGSRARYRDGERLELPERYHRESWETIKRVIAQVADAASGKA